MSRFIRALCLMALLPISAHAASTASMINTNCSGSLGTSMLDGASFVCAGNLTLDGGFITSDSLINISADGDLFIDNVTFTAPNVTFSNLSGLLTFGSSNLINAGSSVNVTSNRGSILILGNINVPKGDIFIGSDPNFVINPSVNLNVRSSVTASKGVNLSNAGYVILNVGSSFSLGVGDRALLVPRIDSPLIGGTLTIQPDVQFISVVAGGAFDDALVLSAVPEPSTYAMVLLGLALISLKRRV